MEASAATPQVSDSNNNRARGPRLVLELTYHEIARLVLLHQTPEQICQRTGLSYTAVTGIMRRSEFKLIYEKLRTKNFEPIDDLLEKQTRDIAEEIKNSAAESFDRLMTLLRSSSSETIQRDVAQDLLDRAGHGKKAADTPPVTINIGTLEAEVLIDALKREQEARERLEGRNILDLAEPAEEHARKHNILSEAVT